MPDMWNEYYNTVLYGSKYIYRNTGERKQKHEKQKQNRNQTMKT